MTTLLYRPGHALANERGFVEKNDFLTWQYMQGEDKRMVVGNSPVTLHVIPDEMPPTEHMGRRDKKIYTSKKKFRDETRARGCIEVGTENIVTPRKPIELDRAQRRHDLKRALWECKNGESRALYELRNGSRHDND